MAGSPRCRRVPRGGGSVPVPVPVFPVPLPVSLPVSLPVLFLLLLLVVSPGAARRLPRPDPTETPTPPVPGVPLDLPQVSRGDKPAAHVVALSWPSPRRSPQWDAAVAPALMQNGFSLRGNRLVVPRDGLYFVYAAAALQGWGCSRRRPALLLLAVSRVSPEYPRDVPLLRAARSVCSGPHRGHRGHRDGLWAESLYQGAVFLLRRGDELAATASAGRGQGVAGEGQAYFGVLGVD